ncbi:MAG TPA: hypothetical protein VNT75_19910, partial [Symbiobacteriaceae bacterium]|nr:hypothetical protein [Symbiobacteriaceae bacterium]
APKDKPWSMVFVAPPRDGVEVEFRVPAKAAVKFRLIDGTFGLPAGTEARPAHLAPGWNSGDWLIPSDTTLVSTEITL